MIEEKYGKNENSMESSNRSKKTVIKFGTACIWLNKLEYQYTDIKKGFFLDKPDWLDVIEYWAQLCKKLETLDPYLMEFRNDGFIEKNMYLLDCVINGPNIDQLFLLHMIKVYFRQVIVNILLGWKKLMHFCKRKGIIVFDFLLAWKHLNLFY